MKNKLIYLLISALVLALVLCSCKNGTPEDIQDDTAASAEPATEPGNGVFDESVSTIDTSRVALCYPEKWAEKVRVDDQLQGGVGKVSFYCNLEGREEKHLFDICFGTAAEIALGQLTPEGASPVSVGVTFAQLSFDDGWTEEEKNTVYAMQEDVNYIINALKGEADFTEIKE